MRPVEFVPETKLASALLAEMQESHRHQMMVIDEYGDVVGLVTIEDLLEELVGEIADETDAEEAMITTTRLGWTMDARLTVDEFCKVTGVEAPDYEGDTGGRPGARSGGTGARGRRVLRPGSCPDPGHQDAGSPSLGGCGVDDATSLIGMRSGFVSVVGRPNVGKSTLVNKMVGSKVSITSKRPQTTRNTIPGCGTR